MPPKNWKKLNIIESCPVIGIAWIELKHGTCYFDYDKIDLVKNYTWHSKKTYNNVYVATTCSITTKKLSFHRLILDQVTSILLIDHINGHGLDNRMCNLRIATFSENTCNSKVRIDNSSGIPGIHYCCRDKKFIVRIRLHGLTYKGGYYDSLEEALPVRNALALKLHGEFTRQLYNF